MEEAKYQAQVNQAHEVSISDTDIQQLDLVPDGEGKYHILLAGKSYPLEVVAADYERKLFTFMIHGRPYEVQLSDQYDQLVKQLGLSVVTSQKVKDVKAPMPGMVLEIAVTAGQEIEKGDKLLILEAMKMENVIKSDGIGKIKTIHIEQGTAVDKGQVLIEME